MEALNGARYDAAVQRYHDAVAVQRERFHSQLKKARDELAELSRKHDRKRPDADRSGSGHPDWRQGSPISQDVDDRYGEGHANNGAVATMTGRELLAQGFVERAEAPGQVRGILNR